MELYILMRYSQIFPHMYIVQSNQIILQWELWVKSASPILQMGQNVIQYISACLHLAQGENF